jgi:ribosomal protein S18 acetylase RimI-like enzyme
MEMRNAIHRGSDDEGRALLARARTVHVASVSAAGLPVLRAVNAVIVDDALAFQAALAGEEIDGLGCPVVASADEFVASIPSSFLDPERADPPTTYYVSVRVEGLLVQVEDPARKARVVAALMAKDRPEGDSRPLSAHHPLRAEAIAELLVAEIPLRHLTLEAELGQSRRPEERVRVLEALWKRGAPGDVDALERIRRRFPELPTPAFLRPHDGLHEEGFRFECMTAGDELDEILDLLQATYWLGEVPRAEIGHAVLASTAAVAARDNQGAVVAFARAVSDGKCAWIYDVAVVPELRSHGLGRELMTVLLDHPAVRSARHVRLTTRDAERFYRRLGFVELADVPRYSPGDSRSLPVALSQAMRSSCSPS